MPYLPKLHPAASPFALAALLLACAATAQAEEQQPQRQTQQAESPNQRIGPRVQSPELPGAGDATGPLARQGQWLAGHGIRPHFNLTQFYLANPSVGLDTGHSEALTIIALGADFDMERLFGWRGGAVHFEQLFVPFTHNLSYGLQVGDALIGKPSPYIPRVNHLTLFTYEQKFLQDRLTVEAGKSNASNYFALPQCNVPPSCTNSILQDSAGFNPPPYANWSLRASYDLGPRLRAQLGAWRSNDAYPFTNGWERRAGDSGGSLSTLYLANLVYRTDYGMEAYPQAWEALLYHNNGLQTDPYRTIAGTSRLADPDTPARTRDGTRGYYLSGRKTFWRADGGHGDTAAPKALTAFANFTQALDQENTNGIARQAFAGVILSAPWRQRPFDSYSLNLKWAQLTRSEQRLLEDAYTLSGGQGDYRPGRDSLALAVDGNFVLGRSVILSATLSRVWDASSWLNPYTGRQPRDGYAVGLYLHLKLDQWLGLAAPHP